MISFPPAKINLGLRILAKRLDGYHNIETCFYPLPFTDVLEVIPAAELSFTTTGLDIPGKALNNLCLRAYELISADFNLSPVQIHLHKVLPTGAGLGGGSSDAAHTILLLNKIFELGLTDDKMKAYAAQLGSDCPFFIHHKPMIGTGRGEVLKDITIDLSHYYLLLLNPGVHVSTAEAYAGIKPAEPSVELLTVLARDIIHWKALLQNDFEETVCKNYPIIEELKNTLYAHGAVYASMSGSGSSVFGLFSEPKEIPNLLQYKLWAGYLKQ